MNRDFVEMLSALFAANAEFLVVGAHAVAAHGRPRATGDLDLWVRPSPDNARKVLAALRTFGAPLFDLTLDDLTTPGIVFQMGLPPYRIDILTGISGVTFDEAWPDRLVARVDGLDLPFIWSITAPPGGLVLQPPQTISTGAEPRLVVPVITSI